MSKPRRSKAWWVVAECGQGNRVGRCTRCGRTLELELPVNLKAFVMYMRAFVQEHLYCKEGDDAGI